MRYAQIRAQHIADNAAIFAKARRTEAGLTAAIALGTIHRFRLETLRGHVRHALEEYQADELTAFMGQYDETFRTEIAAAERADYRASAAEATVLMGMVA